MEPCFKIGDNVKSSKGDTAVQLLGKVWVARVVKVMTGVQGAPDGCAYETHGYWFDPAKPKAKAKRPTARQLWANHLQVL